MLVVKIIYSMHLKWYYGNSMMWCGMVWCCVVLCCVVWLGNGIWCMYDIYWVCCGVECYNCAKTCNSVKVLFLAM